MDKEQQKHLVAVEMALLALGMPPNLKGFYYIKDAVWMLLQSGGHIRQQAHIRAADEQIRRA